MFYRISQHAREKMALRGISEADVHATLNAPGQIVPEDAGRNAYQSKRTSGGRTTLLRVIVVDTQTPAVVVTVYRTTQVDKYWI